VDIIVAFPECGVADRADRRTAVAGTRCLNADLMIFGRLPCRQVESKPAYVAEGALSCWHHSISPDAEADSMAFIARGREYRSEFHVNPTYEIHRWVAKMRKVEAEIAAMIARAR